MITRNRASACDFRELLSPEIEHFFSFLAANWLPLLLYSRSGMPHLTFGRCANSISSSLEIFFSAHIFGERNRSLSAARYFISFRKVFPRQIKPRFPSLSTRRALLENRMAVLSVERREVVARGHAGQDTFREESFRSVLRNLPQHATRRRKWSKENRRGHPGGIADSKVALRNAWD